MTILTSNQNSVGAGSDESRGWQSQIKSAIRSLDELCEVLNLPLEYREKAQAIGDFPLFATRSYVSRISPENPSDPLLLQVLPVPQEDILKDGFVRDPLVELDANPAPGMLHKYKGRALLVTTGACAIHCRYCFRRHFPYQTAPKSVNDWEPTIQAIEQDHTIDEVLLSGGDPLMLVDSTFGALINRIEVIEHVKRVRIHSRMPIVLPDRVTDTLLETLSATRLQKVIVIHANHANELDRDVERTLSRLAEKSDILLNQSVLLKGVNDSAESLIALSQRLIQCKVLPYYLHQLDRVQGAAHFEVPIKVGKALIDQMRASLPGYAVPRYAQEVPGEPNKTILA